MGKSKGPSLPATPTYQNDPVFKQGYEALLQKGLQLTEGDLTGGLAWLKPTIDTNNTSLALAAAQGTLQPQFRDTLQQITNAAAANGQLESSTFTDALARSQSDLNSQYQSIVSQQAIRDAEMANQNRLSLFGTGLNTVQTATGFGLSNQNAQNQFNLDNYSNQVAKALQDHSNSKNPGFFGNFISGISPLAHDIYSSSGYNVPGMGIQQSLMTMASAGAGGAGNGLFGTKLGGISGQTNNPVTGKLSYAPGSSAFDSFGGLSPYQKPNFDNPFFNGLRG